VPRLQSGEPRERDTVQVLEKTATRTWVISIQLDCGHPLLTLMTEVLGNREGLWWCTPCESGNHVERIYR